jgi:lactoylglutathione lyase
MPLSFFGKESMEPSVIAWMPTAAVYFRDPDGHMLEYLTMLNDKERRPDIGILSGLSGSPRIGKSCRRLSLM